MKLTVISLTLSLPLTTILGQPFFLRGAGSLQEGKISEVGEKIAPLAGNRQRL